MKLPIKQVRLVVVGEVEVPHSRVEATIEAVEILQPVMDGLDRENLTVLLLDQEGNVLAIEQVAVGTMDSTLARPRELIKSALLVNATRVIIGHNHPGSSPQPSNGDLEALATVKAILALVDVRVDDFIIFGARGRWVSLKELLRPTRPQFAYYKERLSAAKAALAQLILTNLE